MTDTNQDPEKDEVNEPETDNVVHDDLLADEDGDVDNLVEDRDYTAPA
ncbi:hypothetical protein [Spirosoma rhododendri]|uniref:Uncharacterized protein n=1 Tax=Spirosoma rhododendri TaxID=2728024 RepID=A0A7L5DN16_9BACT|nr:hypothetical protein [Spirosoma rhododendri]QJD79874.1 hypothetical protein HH216_16715 [Spirosoma rhododendri]